jgi:hypothetical protein
MNNGIEIKDSTNYLIDWESSSEEAIKARKHYLKMLRGLLRDLASLNSSAIGSVFHKWNVYFIYKDDFDRVNLDEPQKG